MGSATSRELVRKGALVALIDVNADSLNALAEELGEPAEVWTADITDGAQLERAVSGAVSRFGGLDAVVANAGIEI